MRARLTIDVEYEDDDMLSAAEVESVLNYLAEHAANHGLITGDFLVTKDITHEVTFPEPPVIDVQIICHPEETVVRGNAMASGDEEADRAAEEAIIAELEAGNQWAWCCVEVKVSIGPCPCCGQDRVHSEFLGCCSYHDEVEFLEGGYYDDMVAECLTALGYENE